MPIFLRLAMRDLRGSLRGFRILVACLALGVFAIAAAGSADRAVQAGMARDAQTLLGGDLELSQTYRTLEPEQRALLAQHGVISQAHEVRVMARTLSDNQKGGDNQNGAGWRQALVELKAVDAAYPLYGQAELSTTQPLAAALARQEGGAWGTVIDPALATRLGVQVGERLRVGDAVLQITALVLNEPGRATMGAIFGPRLMIAADALSETGLLQIGSIVREVTALKITDGTPAHSIAQALEAAFPHAGWQVRQLDDASPGLKRFIGTVTLYLTLVGLTALLVGGLGVANAVQAYLESRVATIATLKTLGASSRLVLQVYSVQIALLAGAGVVLGIVAGAVLPFIALPLLATVAPIPMEAGVYAAPLLQAAGFGLLIALVFALWPILRSRATPAAILFRAADGGEEASQSLLSPNVRAVIGWKGAATLVMGTLALAGLTVITAERKGLALGFIIGALACLLLFRGAALLVMAGARRLIGCSWLVQGRPGVRLALSNLYRPGTQTPSLVMSLGLGLSVLVTIALIEANLHRQITETLPKDGPAFYFIDIQSDQRQAFLETVAAVPGARVLSDAGIVRGRIVALKGQPVQMDQVAPDVQWAVRGDRALTSSQAVPDGALVSVGKWWPADYAGPPLASLAANLAQGLGVGIGDTITVNVLGREITATVSNLREVQWSSLAMNFAVILTPQALAGAPTTWIASVAAPPEAEDLLQRRLAQETPNVSGLAVREALGVVQGILEKAGLAVRATAALTLLSGALVLGGALAAGQRRRSYEAVILKVLGAARPDILRAHAMEYAAVGLSTGTLAVFIGGHASWAVLRFVMRTDWVPLPGVAAAVVVSCVLLVACGGLFATLRALSVKAAPVLRQE